MMMVMIMMRIMMMIMIIMVSLFEILYHLAGVVSLKLCKHPCQTESLPVTDSDSGRRLPPGKRLADIDPETDGKGV